MLNRDIYQAYIHPKKFINTVLKYRLELQYKSLTVFRLAKKHHTFASREISLRITIFARK